MVCVRPSKGVGGGEPIAAGVVYRVKDTAIEVAVDDAPDSDGVDQARFTVYKRFSSVARFQHSIAWAPFN